LSTLSICRPSETMRVKWSKNSNRRRIDRLREVIIWTTTECKERIILIKLKIKIMTTNK
jgi:hypothetical protein